MQEEIFWRIKGYLDGLSNIISFYGVCYSHFYEFTEYKYKTDINECVSAFWENSYVKRHEPKIVGLVEVDDWQSELFNFCSDWFFSLFTIQNFKVTYEDEYGNKTPAEKDKESNIVVNDFIKLIKSFFDGTNMKAYRLLTEPDYEDEFAWDQYFFDCNGVVYVLHFYQNG